DQSDIELIWKELENNPRAEVTVDLENRVVECGAISTRFQIDDYTRWRLMEGLDDIGLTLRSADAIDAFEASRPDIKPTTLPARFSGVYASSPTIGTLPICQRNTIGVSNKRAARCGR